VSDTSLSVAAASRFVVPTATPAVLSCEHVLIASSSLYCLHLLQLTYIFFTVNFFSQVDFVKLLMDKLNRLHRKYVDTPLAAQFPRPAFKVRYIGC
jgi:hypothetical protein